MNDRQDIIDRIGDALSDLPETKSSYTVEPTTVNKTKKFLVRFEETELSLTVQQLQVFEQGFRLGRSAVPAVKIRAPRTPSRFADAVAALRASGECEYDVPAETAARLKGIRNGLYAALWAGGFAKGSFAVKTVRHEDGSATLEVDAKGPVDAVASVADGGA
jgi:hypothetical protein